MIAAILVCLVVCAAPWAFGAVEPLWSSLAAGACLVVCAAELARRAVGRSGAPELPTRTIRLLVLVPAVALVALVPLPPAVHRLLAPGAAGLLDEIGVAGWRPLALVPHATLEAAVLAAAYAGTFWVISRAAIHRTHAAVLTTLLLVTGCALAVFGIVQRHTGYDPRHPTIYSVQLWEMEVVTPFGPYVNRNHFAGAMEVFAGIGAGVVGFALARRRWAGAMLPALAVALVLAALLMTTSRGGILGVAAAAAFLVAVQPPRLRARAIAVVVVVAAVAIGAVVAAGLWDDLSGRLFSVYGRWRNRFAVQGDALAVFASNPLFGTGAGSFALAYPPFQTVDDVRFFNDAHSDWAQLLMETGLAGLALGVAIVVELGRRVRAAARSAGPGRWLVLGPAAGCVAICAHGAFEVNLHVPANALLAVSAASLSFAAALREEDSPGRAPVERLSIVR